MEGAPVVPETKEKEPISDDQCREAMKAGQFEIVSRWYAQEGEMADKDTTGRGHFDLTVRLATLQFESDVIDEDTGENYGVSTIEAATLHAVNAGDFETAKRLDAVLADWRAKQTKA
jgi:hypothetical protein